MRFGRLDKNQIVKILYLTFRRLNIDPKAVENH